ncbi:DUF934 domain-containing protein [Sagittula sp. SSi028]|uniref:DUF934 domain-containing protein n=1 Tax=Sagittula sp. SSi028 TaxID=3400636 RepID=UPI003AF53533
MSIIVRDDGFHAADDTEFLDLASDTDPATLTPDMAANIRIAFPSSADGRGFSLAKILRLQGFTGRLRAQGHVLADQYAMARRCGFDEVEIDQALADRQPEAQWIFRADWQAHDYQSRIRG